jgi:WS/DGAT/MGAT family acyltransferase
VTGGAERLSPLDVSFLYRESPTTVMHGGTIAIFTAEGDPPSYAWLCDVVRARIADAPRYRQRVRMVPGRLANPVWVEDEHFDLTYHVRRSAIPKPGSDDQLRELVGRVQSRQLDRDRPLWELYLVEGLAPDDDGRSRFAIITKVHHALGGHPGTRDIATMVLGEEPSPDQPGAAQTWEPGREPSPLDLVVQAVADNLRRPTQVLETVRGDVVDIRATAARFAGAAGTVLSQVRTSLRPAPASPLEVRVGEQRRVGMAATTLDDHRRVRKAYGGTVNDVVLATVAGALRTWLLTRGESVTPATTLRAMVPVSVQGGDDPLAALFVDLPVGEASPAVRLHRVAYATKAHRESGRSVPAGALSSLSGFAPPTIHAGAARLGARMTRRLFNLVVANVPGPQFPLYLGGAEMTATYPVVPLAPDRALAVGVTSYNGGMYYGLNVDRDAMPDVDVLAQCIEESLAELVETVR